MGGCCENIESGRFRWIQKDASLAMVVLSSSKSQLWQRTIVLLVFEWMKSSEQTLRYLTCPIKKYLKFCVPLSRCSIMPPISWQSLQSNAFIITYSRKRFYLPAVLMRKFIYFVSKFESDWGFYREKPKGNHFPIFPLSYSDSFPDRCFRRWQMESFLFFKFGSNFILPKVYILQHQRTCEI